MDVPSERGQSGGLLTSVLKKHFAGLSASTFLLALASPLRPGRAVET